MLNCGYSMLINASLFLLIHLYISYCSIIVIENISLKFKSRFFVYDFIYDKE